MNQKNIKFIINHIKRRDSPFNMQAKHYHDKYEIYYLLNGERYYFINNRTFHVQKGDIVLIGQKILHKTNTTGKHRHERCLLQFDEQFLNKELSETNNFDLYQCFQSDQYIYKLDLEKQIWIEDLLFKIIKEKRQKNIGYTIYIKTLLIELLIFLNRLTTTSTPSSGEYLNDTHEKMAEIATYINENFQIDLSLDKLAKKFNYSPIYISTTFKKVTGFNFVEYKNNVRTKEASKLLQNSNLNITEIARKVGYNNITHFGRIFKKITGYSPLAYRKFKKSEYN